MSFIQDMKNRSNQRKAESFIKKIAQKSENEVKQAFLDNKEFYNNEIVLRYLFFNFVGLISMLPVEFQKKMINSNLSMFKHGSSEAKKSLVSDWLKDNKFFMNVKNLDLDNEEFVSYICMYFNQVEDVSKLYMDDLYRVIDILSKQDLKRTEDLVNSIKDSLTERQWDFVLKANPIFIKYANQEVQNKYSENEAFSLYLSGSARDNYNKKQIEKIKDNEDLINEMTTDVQREYIINNPYIVDSLNDESLTNLLKYDIDLIKYIDIGKFKNKDILYDILENTTSKNISEIINIFIAKGLLNAKGKLYRFDPSSGNFSYQYTKRLIKIIQNLSVEQIISLIDIDVNYVLPFVVPFYSDKDDRKTKENEALESNSRCLNLFSAYYGDKLYSKYYKIINKIYNEFISNIEKYNYSTDFNCMFELFKVLFNRKIVENNNSEKISVFVGISLLYKGKENTDSQNAAGKLLNDMLYSAYGKQVKLWTDLYNINSLELFDSRLSFISEETIMQISQLNGIRLSLLLYIIKNEKYRKSFINYYDILSSIFDSDVTALMHALDNYMYYKDILMDIDGKDLNEEEINNLLRLVLSKKNPLNVCKKDELLSYDINILKKLIKDFSESKSDRYHKNIFCNYFFNKSYDEKEYVSNIKSLCNVYNSDLINELEMFSKEEIELLITLKLLFSVDNSELLLSFIENYMAKKININYVSILNFFNKLEKYACDVVNRQIVNINDIEMLYESNKSAVSKRIEEDVEIYEFYDQDFKILSSYTNDGYHYDFLYISQLERNCYGYDSITNDISFKFTSFGEDELIKTLKGKYNAKKLIPNFIFVKDKVTPEILRTASENNLKIICMGGNKYE